MRHYATFLGTGCYNFDLVLVFGRGSKMSTRAITIFIGASQSCQPPLIGHGGSLLEKVVSQIFMVQNRIETMFYLSQKHVCQHVVSYNLYGKNK